MGNLIFKVVTVSRLYVMESLKKQFTWYSLIAIACSPTKYLPMFVHTGPHIPKKLMWASEKGLSLLGSCSSKMGRPTAFLDMKSSF